ncbi:peroxidase P7-like [Oryza brachyantha]|uniref:peroxidase P7-like n=1 Tax=Oryza brachyantha TaxID=4533 RepID=UPI001ADA59E5|nr:peroxidase P7-like [Oryza brachyantha]
MASGSHSWHCCLLLAFFLVFSGADGLSTAYYATSCPSLQQVVRATVSSAIQAERRIGASLIRLFFHDCFVQACDASILLDDVPETGFVGEKTAGPNVNSVRGYEVIDRIKANVEDVCPGVVSCADIVALAARDSTALLGGPNWAVPLGRLDSTTASLAEANRDLPGPDSDLGTLIARFGAKGLSPRDMTALSGSHTVGFSQCTNFRAHIYNDTDIDPAFAALRRRTCPAAAGNGDSNLAPLDVQTQNAFDNAYYHNLLVRRGLLHSDQVLFNGGSQDALVQQYSSNPSLFAADFAKAMVKMGNLCGAGGEVRCDCRVVNDS